MIVHWVAAFLICLTAASVSAIPLGTEITIYDGNPVGSSTNPLEDEEVEPRCQWDQNWDLEGYFLQGETLTMVGGYDFLNGYGGFGPGHLFIDLDGDGQFGEITDGSGYQNTTVNETFGYEYALALDASSYTAYLLDGDSWTETVWYSQNQESNPWRAVIDGPLASTAVHTGNLLSYDGLLSSEVGGLQGDDHFAMAIDLSTFLAAEGLQLTGGMTFHYTYQCGNDNMIGRIPAVPDNGATLLLLGASLLGLAVLRFTFVA